MTPFEDEEEARPGEPEEFDPDSLGPDVPDPAADLEIEDPSLGAAADVDADLVGAFWGAVVLLNVAIAALSVGAMLVYFRGDWSTGGGALLVGAVAAVFTARFYRRGRRLVRRSRTDEPPTSDPDTTGRDESEPEFRAEEP